MRQRHFTAFTHLEPINCEHLERSPTTDLQAWDPDANMEAQWNMTRHTNDTALACRTVVTRNYLPRARILTDGFGTPSKCLFSIR